MIRCCLPGDEDALLRLWNRDAVAMGYAPMGREEFRRTFPEHPEFSRELTFLLEAEGEIQGFITGCAPADEAAGYVTCLVLAKSFDTREHTRILLLALEEELRRRGRRWSVVSFFNPMHLSWVIPGTPGHRHNNAPGIPTHLPLNRQMLELGYEETSRQLAMYRPLGNFSLPAEVTRQIEEMAARGNTVALYDPRHHRGLAEMVDALGNPLWSREIPEAAARGKALLVALHGQTCAGFAGPIYPEPTGRGYFAGLAVAEPYRNRGFGKALFYRLVEQEQSAGANYMSLFTGQDNPARKIYEAAGFRGVRTFSVLRKPL